MYIILAIVAVLVLLALKHERWQLMLACAAVACALSALGVQGVVDAIEYAEEYVDVHEMRMWQILLLLTVVMALAMMRNKQEKRKKDTEDKKKIEDELEDINVEGFTAENEYQPKPGWDDFVKLLCERLSKTRLWGESFALGIAGEWGSGKTTFLRQMKPELEKAFRVVEFNPWTCMNAKSVVTDFFDALKTQMPKGDRGLQDDIVRYVRLLVGANVMSSAWGSIADFVAGSGGASVSGLKESIERKLAKAETRYVVLMDDLDRLESQELFETLRLIRVTASFSNIMFVVTYDRRHIVDMLSANRISNGEQFIKKIFSTEIVIPEMEPYAMPMLLMDEIRRLVGDDSPIPQEIESAVYSKDLLDTYDLLSYLRNYRDVKRFAMAFAVDAYAVEKKTPGEFSYSDFFWLEILRYVDYEVYDDLRTNPLKYLQHMDLRLVAKDGLESLLEGKVESAGIIHKVFGNATGRNDMNGVVFVNNFRNYFSFRVQENKLSHAEFEALFYLNDLDVLKDRLANYKMQNKLPSLLEMVRQVEMGKLRNIDARKRYLSMLFFLIPYFNIRYLSTIREKIKEDCFEEDSRDEMTGHVKSLIRTMVHEESISRGVVNVAISQFYSRFLAYDMDEEGGRYDYKSIVDDEFLVEASEDNMRKIFEKRNGTIDIAEATRANAPLRKFMGNATVIDWADVSYEPVTNHYKCLPLAAFLEYFKAHKSDDIDDFMKPLEFDEEEQRYMDEEPSFFDGRKEMIEGIFGSGDNFKTIINECFSNPQEKKDKWLKYWRLK